MLIFNEVLGVFASFAAILRQFAVAFLIAIKQKKRESRLF
jgi:hypothetical protein